MNMLIDIQRLRDEAQYICTASAPHPEAPLNDAYDDIEPCSNT